MQNSFINFNSRVLREENNGANLANRACCHIPSSSECICPQVPSTSTVRRLHPPDQQFPPKDLLPMLAADLVCKTGVGRDFGLLPARSQEEVKQVRDMLCTLGSRLWSPLPYWKIPGLARHRSAQMFRDASMIQAQNCENCKGPHLLCAGFLTLGSLLMKR